MELNQSEMNDKELVTDLLDSEKLLCSVYKTATVEAATPNIRTEFKEALNDTLDIQNNIFDTMNKNGWYPVDAADPSKIQVAKNKYPQNAMSN